MSNLIKTEAQVQGSPSESQAFRDLQTRKGQLGCGRGTPYSSECLLPLVNQEKWDFLQA